MQFRYSHLFIGLLVAGLLAGCSATVPKWTTGAEHKKYGAKQYITVMASAESEDKAGEAARKKLREIFFSRYDHRTLKTLSLGDITIDGKQQNLHAQRADEILDERLGVMVDEAKVLDTWVDNKSGQAFVLVGLPRAQAVAKLNEELYTLDRATQAYLREGQLSSDSLSKIQLAARAVDTQIARRSMTRSLKAVDRQGNATPPRWRLSKLSASLDGLLLRVRVAQEVSEDPSNQLAKSLTEALRVAGFYADPGAKPEFIMRGKMELKDGGERDGWRWINGAVEINLVESRTGRSRGRIRWAIQAAGRNEQQAKQRVVSKIDSLLKSEMRGTIVKFATS